MMATYYVYTSTTRKTKSKVMYQQYIQRHKLIWDNWNLYNVYLLIHIISMYKINNWLLDQP